MLAAQFGERALRLIAGAMHNSGRLQASAEVHTGRHDQQPDQERNPPSPRSQRSRRHRVREQHAQRRAQQRRAALAGQLPAHHVSAARSGRQFHRQGRGDADVAARGEPLQQAARDQNDRGGNTDCRKGWAKGDGGRPQGGEPDGRIERRASSAAIRVRSDQHRAKRTHEKPDAERSDCQQ